MNKAELVDDGKGDVGLTGFPTTWGMTDSNASRINITSRQIGVLD
jgi:hypothetical protein